MKLLFQDNTVLQTRYLELKATYKQSTSPTTRMQVPLSNFSICGYFSPGLLCYNSPLLKHSWGWKATPGGWKATLHCFLNYSPSKYWTMYSAPWTRTFDIKVHHKIVECLAFSRIQSLKTEKPEYRILITEVILCWDSLKMRKRKHYIYTSKRTVFHSL